ncbi:porin family protein [Sphingobacterium sp. UT-1RO-CII-1]|uniref:porin family protein n=1 Tax=Sphingobacterium sp. UT-1RO-CII-1 TaxID=2995225 RepID=UPI00227B3C74|nr:porin family protein [Sphingobacterium sp. UT-1RO-CII-1]MCY4780725.1 porin family protein [Sphingobacterium sp. UT-1RO-CII-1]
MIKKMILMLLWLSAFLSYGQTDGIEWGMFGGVNYSGLMGSGLKEFAIDGKSRAAIGLDVGLRLKQPLGDRWGFRHEVGFNMLNTKVELKEKEAYTSQLRRMTVVVSPVNMVHRWRNLSLYGGPYFGFLTGASIQRLGSDGKKYRDKDIYGTAELEGDYMQKLDIGVKVGVDFSFSRLLGVTLQFARGIAPIMENAESKNQLSIYNQSGSIMLYYKIGKVQ